MSEYRFTTTIEPRYRDLDTYEHVNHAVHVTYMENARIDFFRTVLDVLRIDTVIANLEIDYERPIRLTHEVEVGVGVADVGETSLSLSYELRADGDVAATGRTTQVILDEDGDPTPLPDEWRERLDEHRAPAADD